MSFLNRSKLLLHSSRSKSQLNKLFSTSLKSTTSLNSEQPPSPPSSSSTPTKLIDLISKPIKSEKDAQVELKHYDPPYLNKKPPFPNYELLNINIKGYETSSLDTYFRYIEKLCLAFKIDIVEAYCMPARSFKIKTYQQFSSNLDKEYKLNMYHRVVRIQNLKSTMAPFLFETIQLNLPEGVQLSVSHVNKEEDEFRYVPDIELNELKEKLEEMSKKPKEEEIAAAKANATVKK